VVTFAAGPARDFYLAASQHYTVVSASLGETRVNSYALAGHADAAQQALRNAVDALQSFNVRFGPYPYTEFDVAATPMQALGIEYPGLVGIVLTLYDPQGQVAGLPSPVLLESVVAHEVAHQWFYNAVGNDQVDEPWLDEAAAQYLTMLYYADTYGQQGAAAYRASWAQRWERVGRAEIPIGLPTGSYTPQEYGAIVYGRGPLFLDALAGELGQAQFDRFLRDYYQSHQWGNATRAEFQQLAETHCNCDLAPLFAEGVDAK
jgi:aminopeptidase N